MKPMGMSGRTVWSLVLLGSVLVILAGPAWGQIPTESDVYVDRGILAYGQGQYQDALQAFQEAVRMNPDNVNALYYVGMVYLAMDQPAAAQEALEQGIKRVIFSSALSHLPCPLSMRSMRSQELSRLGFSVTARS